MPLRNKLQNTIDLLLFKGTYLQIANENEILRQQVANAERLRSVAILASGLAHEIRNPLTAIRTFTEYLPKRLNDRSFLEKFSQIVGKEVHRINDLITALLEFAKPSEPKMQPLDINGFLNDTMVFLNSRFLESHIKVEKSLMPGRIIVNADSGQLRQVLLNILINAIEAMPSGGTLTIRTAPSVPGPRSPGPFVRITIKDSGCGISKADLPHIFDPFFSKKDSGTGLGLAISHGIIDRHGGKILVDSTVGQGTTFALEFPLHEGEEDPESEDEN